MTYSQELIAFIKGWEAFKASASVDPLSGRTDIGFGHVLQLGEKMAHITYEQGVAVLLNDLRRVDSGVASLVKVPLSQNQWDALVSFAYNCGLDIDDDDKPEGLGDSTLLKYVNAAQFDRAALQFTLWVNSGGKREWGLAKRRFAEQAIWSFGNYSWRP